MKTANNLKGIIMSKPRITNRNASDYTRAKREFKANNIFAEWTADNTRYIVYSYGPHWPLYIYDSTTDQWYANFSHFGRTTSKHKSQANPGAGMADMIPLHVDDMIKVAAGGITQII